MSPTYKDHRSTRYEPPVIDLENKNSSHALIVELTGVGKNVLEVGTSTGYISRILKDRGNTVTGIEIDPEAGEIAGQHCDSMIIGDIEKLDLDAYFAPSSFDVIIFGDVLEHLVSPEDVLRKVKKYLRPDGFLVVSLPNVCHGDVILNLLMGDFKYTPMGLLDVTHLRFFGLRNIIDLFSRCGYSITDIHTTVLPVGSTELRVDSGLVPGDLVKFVKSLPNASVYQYVFKASPSSAPEVEGAVPTPDLDALFRVAIEERIQAETGPLLEELRAYEARAASLAERVGQLTEETQSLQRIIADRDAQISSLTEQIALSDEELQSLKEALADRDAQVASLDEQVEQLTEETQSLQRIIADRDAQISSLNEQIALSDEELQSLKEALADRDAQVASLDEQIAQSNEEIRSLQQILTDRDGKISSLNEQIERLTDETRSLQQTIADRDAQVASLTEQIEQQAARLMQVSNELADMKQSIVWRLLMKFHNGFVERALPQNTRRRELYDLGLKGSRILANEGWRSFWWKFNEYRYLKRVVSKGALKVPKPRTWAIQPSPSVTVEQIDCTVSVIIPTKNAGPEFEYTLEKISNQKGIKNVEIIIVDSGSTDETLSIAQKYASKVISIAPEDFNHGNTRNLAADQADGDYLLFTVQDAIPISDYLLYNMVTVLERDQTIAAATCRQVPQSNADLFACYLLWNHYRCMDFRDDMVTYSDPENFKKLPMLEKRRLAGLDNVCCCIKREVFNQFRFRSINFAEDLDLGIRLIESGNKLCYLHSTGVIHSHNRDAMYFLKRFYVDSKLLTDMFGIIPTISERNVCNGVNAVISLYNSLNASLTILCCDDAKTTDVDQFIVSLKHNMSLKYLKTSGVVPRGELGVFLLRIKQIEGIPPSFNDCLFREFNEILDNAGGWLRSIYQVQEISALSELAYKLFAMVCGAYLGNLYYYNRGDERMCFIDAMLSKEV